MLAVRRAMVGPPIATQTWRLFTLKSSTYSTSNKQPPDHTSQDTEQSNDQLTLTALHGKVDGIILEQKNIIREQKNSSLAHGQDILRMLYLFFLGVVGYGLLAKGVSNTKLDIADLRDVVEPGPSS